MTPEGLDGKSSISNEDYLGGNLTWTPPTQQTSLEGYVVYLANSPSGQQRVWLLGFDGKKLQCGGGG